MKKLVLIGIVFSLVGVGEIVVGAPQKAQKVDKESTQGYFVAQLRHELTLDKYFAGALTLADVAEKLAEVGCVPDQGWRLDQELTLDDLLSAYNRMGGKVAGRYDLDPWAFRSLLDKKVQKAYARK